MNLTAFLALVRKDLVLYFSNRRALVMSILAPIVIAAFFGAIFGAGMEKPSRIAIGLADRDASAVSKAVAAAVQADPAFAVETGDEASVVALARSGKVRASIVLPSGSERDRKSARAGIERGALIARCVTEAGARVNAAVWARRARQERAADAASQSWAAGRVGAPRPVALATSSRGGGR